MFKFIGTAVNVGTTFFGGPFGKLAIYAIAALFTAGTLFTFVKIHDDGVARKATDAYNAAQITQLKNDNKVFQDQLQTIAASQVVILNKTATQNTAVAAKASTVKYYLGTPAAQAADRPSSEILKETIKRLSSK